MGDEPMNAWSAERVRARWTGYLLFGCLALNFAAIVTALEQHALLGPVAAAAVLPPAPAANGARHAALGVLQLLAFIATGTVWLLWLHQAYRNLRLVGTKRSRFTARWAVGYWFVPFLNFVRPYQIVKELWQRSESLNDRDSFTGLPAPALLPWWWGTYLTGLLGRLQATLALGARSLHEPSSVTDATIVGDAAGVVAAVLAIMVVRGISGRQQLFQAEPDA